MARRREPAIGIDLGTTYSCVAVWQNNKIEIITNDQGNRVTPSCVSFNDHERLVGEGAWNEVASNAANIVFDIKRLTGKKFSEESVQSDKRLWPFTVIAGKHDKPTIVVQYKNQQRQFTPEEISAMILSKLKESAEQFLACPVKNAVVTVPAYFNDSQRQATKDAAAIAGLNVLQIINEPTAAAIAYGLNNSASGRTGTRKALIFDLGGGTFDVSLVEVDDKGTITVKATDGDTHLGGEDFDNRMVYHFMDLFRRRHGLDISGDPKAIRKLRKECERVKRTLSSSCSNYVNVDALYNGIDFHAPATRAMFEQLNDDMFTKCLQTVERCLTVSQTNRRSIDDVVLVGGSTRIPKIQAMLREFFGITNLCVTINADEAVAFGAATQAARLNGDIGGVSLVDVTPLSLGVNVRGGITHVVIPRNTPIPCSGEHLYTTSQDNMTQIRFRVYEGERAESSLNNLLGEFFIHNIRMAKRGAVKFRVVFSIDTNGILTVSARDLETGKKVEVTITNDSGRLSKEQRERMITDARQFELEDEERRNAARAMNHLDAYISEIETTIRGHPDSDSRRILELNIADVRTWSITHEFAMEHEIVKQEGMLRRLWERIRNRSTRLGHQI